MKPARAACPCLARATARGARATARGIVFGVARSEKPCSNSASAGAKPGGIEAPETIPSSLGE